MKSISDKKFSFVTVLVAMIAAFAIFASVSAVGNSAGLASDPVFAEEVVVSSHLTLLETKAKVSFDRKYLLLITGFYTDLLDEDGLYYMGYKYTVDEMVVDTARTPGADAAKYYESVTLKIDPEDTTKTQVVTPSMIYGEDYADYGLLVYEIEFENSFDEEFIDYSDVYVYIDKVEYNQTTGKYDVVENYHGTPFTYADRDRYFPENNGFDEGNLDGWTRNTTSYADGDKHFGGISDAQTFWGEGYPMFGDGYYFSSYAGDSAEGATGTLTSDLFELGGCGYVTYMLGGAGNPLCYITVEKYENDEWSTIAVYRNTEFADIPAGDHSVEEIRGWIGESVFLANFVTFKADLSAYKGDTLRFVIHDEAVNSWGVVFFDELKTYYANVGKLPADAVTAVNQLADKAALWAAIDGAVGAQGDYTAESYNAYADALSAAVAVNGYVASTQAAVDAALSDLNDAYAALEYRVPVDLNGESEFVLAPDGTQDIDLSDYVDENGLTLTYEVASDDTSVATVWAIDDGLFTITGVADGDATVTITVKHLGVAVLTIDLDVEVTTVPCLVAQEVTQDLDLYLLDNKTNYALDFTANVDNPASVALEYSATVSVDGGAASAIDLVNDGYTYAFAGDYDDVPTVVTFAVTVEYEHNGTQYLEYDYVLNITDSTDYRLVNGDFETGDLTGWTLSNSDLGNVIDNDYYWEGRAFNNDGKLFSAYTINNASGYAQEGREDAMGTLTSSTFVIGGSGFITYKLGGAKNSDGVWLDVVDNANGNILGRFYNDRWVDGTDCTLVAYKVDLSAHTGKTAYLRIVDNATSGYGLFFLDSVNTYYVSEPEEGFNEAVAVSAGVPASIYQTTNGDFETGNLYGWKLNDNIGYVSEQSGYFTAHEYDYGKNGTYLFSGFNDNGTEFEGATGTLTSAPFVLGGSGYITYKFGGGVNVLCYVEIIDFATGSTLARFHNDNYPDNMNNGVLLSYRADLSAYIGRTLMFRVCDYATNNWGCISLDNVVTYYATEPDTTYKATDINYQLFNYGFENDLDGWTRSGDEFAHVTTADNYFANRPYNRVGNKLLSGVEDYAAGNGLEGWQGSLMSATFTVGGSGWISFMLGGGNNNCYIEIVDALTGQSLKQYVNGHRDEAVMFRNYADLSAFMGRAVRIRICDYASNDWGCISVDDFIVYYAETPEVPDTAAGYYATERA